MGARLHDLGQRLHDQRLDAREPVAERAVQVVRQVDAHHATCQHTQSLLDVGKTPKIRTTKTHITRSHVFEQHSDTLALPTHCSPASLLRHMPGR